MTVGHLEYQKYSIEDIVIEIDNLIKLNDDESLREWGERLGINYPPEVIERFREASHTLRQSAEMVHRVDSLVSGDDGKTSFMTRWEKEVRPYYNKP